MLFPITEPFFSVVPTPVGVNQSMSPLVVLLLYVVPTSVGA